MRILAIDPGTTESGWVVYDVEERLPIEASIDENEMVTNRIYGGNPWIGLPFGMVVCERIRSQGKAVPVGATTFETCEWSGSFRAIAEHCDLPFHWLSRKDVKMHLCERSVGIDDGNIYQTMIDRFGGNRKTAVGKKKAPGPCYGFREDMWQALALAVTWSEKEKEKKDEQTEWRTE